MTLVVKIGGSAGVTTLKIAREIAQCIAKGQRIVVVHGGSDLTTRFPNAWATRYV